MHSHRISSARTLRSLPQVVAFVGSFEGSKSFWLGPHHASSPAGAARKTRNSASRKFGKRASARRIRSSGLLVVVELDMACQVYCLISRKSGTHSDFDTYASSH